MSLKLNLFFTILLFAYSPLLFANPLAEWRLDELNWSATPGEVIDSSGNNHHGTARNGLSTREGVLCRGGNFRGEGFNAAPNNTYYPARYYIEVPGNGTLSPHVPSVGSAITINGWFNTRRISGVQTIVHKGDGGNSQDYRIYLENGLLLFQFFNINGSPVTGTINYQLSENVNYFFAISALRESRGVNQDLFLSAELYTQTTDTPVFSGTATVRNFNVAGKNIEGNIFVGATKYSANNITNFFDGLIDEVKIYSGLRTTTENIADKNATRVCSGALQCLADDFNNGSLGDTWVTARSSGNFTPRGVNGRLRMTEAIANQSTSATYQRLYPAADNLVVVEFDYWAYGGNGADGLALVLSDAEIAPQPGAFGGPLGYGFKPGIPGFAGGWLGFGIDEYGNYSNEGGSTNVGRRRQSVVVRGSGEGTTGYRYLRGTCNNGTTNVNTNCLFPGVDGNQNTPHRYRFIIDSTQAGATFVSAQRDTKSGLGFQDLILPFNVQNQTGQAPVPENFLLSITGSTGGSTNIHELDNLSICALRSEPVGVLIDHFQLSHPAEMVSCLAAPVEIKACLNQRCLDNADMYTDPVTVTLTADGNASWAGGNTVTLINGVGTAYLRNPIVGSSPLVNIEAVSSVPAAKAFFRDRNRCQTGPDGTPCEIRFVGSGLLFADVDGQLPLNSQTAGETFNGVLRAVRTNATTGACDARVRGPKEVQLGFNCENPGSCIAGQQFTVNGTSIAGNNIGASANRSSVNLLFDAEGSAPLAMNYTDVGQLRLHARLALPEQLPDPAITLQTSSEAFVVRPHTLAVVQATRPDGTANPGTKSTGDGFIAAGEPFNVLIEAQNASGAATPNFGREIVRQQVALVFNALQYPAGGSSGTLSPGATDLAQPAANGRQTITNVSWSEAGSISLQARLVNDSYLAVPDISAKPASDTIGRFYPSHFKLESSEVLDSCRVNPASEQHFSYMGQDSITVNYQVLAQGVNANTLENYDGESYTGTAALLVVAEHNLIRLDAGRLAVTAGQWKRGVYTVEQTDASFNRIAIPDGPYAELQLGLQILLETEQDERDFQVFTLGTDAVALSGTLDLRYGRLILDNAYGPESDNLPLVLRAEYWDNPKVRFVANQQDNCSLLSADWVLLPIEFVPEDGGSVDISVSANPLRPTLVQGSSVINNASQLWLNAPGMRGRGEVKYQVPDWLQYNWSGKETGCSANPADPDDPDCYDENPTAEFMFGRYRGNPRQIYWRERF